LLNLNLDHEFIDATYFMTATIFVIVLNCFLILAIAYITSVYLLHLSCYNIFSCSEQSTGCP